MNKRFCTVNHNPPESYGDCIKACIATLIDRDDVPHTYKGDSVQAWRDIREYLKQHGKTLAIFPSDDAMVEMNLNNPDIPYILMGSTGRANHAIICSGLDVIHNPSPNCKITGPTDLGVWIIGIIGDV